MFFHNFLNYANIVAGLVSFLVAILILARDSDSTINWLFFGSLSAWGISLALNGFNFLYEHPLPGAQIIRDFVTGLGSVGAFFIFTTAVVMLKGEYFLKKPLFMFPLLIVALINTTISVYFDTVVYDTIDNTPGNGIKTTQEPWVMIFIYLIPILLIISSIVIFFIAKKGIADKIIRIRIDYFILGFTFIIAGILVYGSSGIIEQLVTSIPYNVELGIFIIAELFWVAGPILMLIGHNIGRFSSKKEELDFD